MRVGFQDKAHARAMYWYPQDGGIIVTKLGKNPDRWWYESWRQAQEAHPKTTLIRTNPPPNHNPAWYIGAALQWRKEPVRRLGFMREWLHAAVGFATGVIPFIPLWLAPQVWPLVVFGGLFTALGVHLFLRYEEVEEIEIKDWAYRDIGGYANGLAIASGGCAVATAALYKAGVFCNFTGAWC